MIPDKNLELSSECRKVARLLGPSLDGELDAALTLEVDEHVSLCGLCRERAQFKRALSASVARTVKTEASVDFRARALAAMQAAHVVTPEEEARSYASEVAEASQREWSTRNTLRSRASRFGSKALWPLSAAAALAVIWHGQWRAYRSASADAAVARGQSLADIMAEHSRPLPPESNDPKLVRQFERYVGVPVRPPVFSQNARLMGGRVLPVQHERAAMLQYEMDRNGQSQRVSVFIYDPKKIHVDDADLTPRAVGSSEIRVGRSNGYSVAITQRAGVAYLVASDMDLDMSADLIGNAQDN
jgi:anti-sigma factor RsiW